PARRHATQDLPGIAGQDVQSLVVLTSGPEGRNEPLGLINDQARDIDQLYRLGIAESERLTRRSAVTPANDHPTTTRVGQQGGWKAQRGGVRRINGLGQLGGAVDHEPPAELLKLADLHPLPYAAERRELLFPLEQPRSLPLQEELPAWSHA